MFSFPTIDVIIPVYNGEPWLRECLESVFAQRVKPRRVWVVNDGSSDRSMDILCDFPEVTVLNSLRPGSASGARQYALQSCQAEYVAFLDQDDLWHPDHLQNLLSALEKFPQSPAACASFVHFRDGHSPTFSIHSSSVIQIDPWTDFPFARDYEPSGFLYRRSAFDPDGWPVEWQGGADYYLWFFLGITQSILRTPQTTVAKRTHPASYNREQLSGDPLDYLRGMFDVAQTLGRLYIHHDSGRKDFIERRLSILTTMGKMLDSLRNQDEDSFGRDAWAFCKTLDGESGYFKKRVFEDVVFYLERIIRQMKQDRSLNISIEAVYKILFENWPRTSNDFLPLWEAWIRRQRPGRRFYQTLLCDGWTKPRRIKFVAQSCVHRLWRAGI